MRELNVSDHAGLFDGIDNGFQTAYQAQTVAA